MNQAYTSAGGYIVEALHVFSITIVALLLVNIVLLLIFGRNKSNSGDIADLLKRNNVDLRDSVAKQIRDGATEQFQRFGMIQESVQNTLQGNRAETNEQLGKFSGQLDKRLEAIQKQTTDTLQASREETNRRLGEFQAQIDTRLSAIQQGNAENLEKINTTLENKMK